MDKWLKPLMSYNQGYRVGCTKIEMQPSVPGTSQDSVN